MTDGWTIGATVAASVAGVAALGAWPFIGWQAWETRKATRTAAGALVATTAMAVDAARARLDMEAPQIEVTVSGPTKNPQGVVHGGGASNEWPLDAGPFHFPRDEGLDKSLIVTFLVHIVAHGSRPVGVRCRGDLYVAANKPEKATTFELHPGPNMPSGVHEYQVVLRLQQTSGKWSENYRAHVEGRPLPHVARGVIEVADYRDHGIIDTWEVSFGAWPIEPEPDLDGQWRLTWANPNEAHPQWTEHDQHPLAARSYWQSRSQGTKLPEPVYELPTPRSRFRRR